MLFYYLRHADPIYIPDSLTDLGKRQAEALAHRLAAHGIDKIYASSSKRAQDTARPTAEITKKEVTVLDWANETYHWKEATADVGDGRKNWMMHDPEYKLIFRSDEVRALGKEWYTHKAFRDHPIGEGMKRIGREADAFFAELGYEHDRTGNFYRAVRHNNDRVAFFAHQGFGTAFLAEILDVPYPEYCTSFDLNHSSMTVINFSPMPGTDKVIPIVWTLSNDSHLYREGLPTRFCNTEFI